MRSLSRAKLYTAGDALAAGAFLLLWLAIWPVWLFLSRHFPGLFTKSSSSHG
jgi:hypothetical protein